MQPPRITGGVVHNEAILETKNEMMMLSFILSLQCPPVHWLFPHGGWALSWLSIAELIWGHGNEMFAISPAAVCAPPLALLMFSRSAVVQSF